MKSLVILKHELKFKGLMLNFKNNELNKCAYYDGIGMREDSPRTGKQSLTFASVSFQIIKM
jgi:hypothetical protein